VLRWQSIPLLAYHIVRRNTAPLASFAQSCLDSQLICTLEVTMPRKGHQRQVRTAAYRATAERPR
jgi:hypothetical protein